MPTFPLPSPTSYGIATLRWSGREIVSRVRNPFTGQVLTQYWDGHWWQGTLTFSLLDQPEGRALSAWLAALRRSGTNGGTFFLGDPSAPEPLGSAKDTPGTPQINGAAQTGEAINIDGLPVSTTGYLLEGDYIQFGTGTSARLKKVLDDVDSNGAGEATVNVWPPVRANEAPADNTAVVVSDPVGVFISPTPLSEWQVRPPVLYEGITLEVAEKF